MVIEFDFVIFDWIKTIGVIRRLFALTYEQRFFEKLEEIKSFSILDKLNTEQQAFMERAMATPTYSLKLISGQGVRSYVISEVKGQIPGMTVVKSDTFALSTDEKQSFVLIDKDELKTLTTTKSADLK